MTASDICVIWNTWTCCQCKCYCRSAVVVFDASCVCPEISVFFFLSSFLCRSGRDGYIQVDGGAALHGQSKGKSSMVNTKGSIYLGEWTQGAQIDFSSAVMIMIHTLSCSKCTVLYCMLWNASKLCDACVKQEVLSTEKLLLSCPVMNIKRKTEAI